MKEIYATISEGEIVEQTLWKRFVKSLPNGRCSFKYESKQKHSQNQRGYYHAVIVPHFALALREAGYNDNWTKDQIHESLKLKFNPIDVLNLDTGEIEQKGGSTKRMTKERYRQYIDDILSWAADKLSYFIPEPINGEDKYNQAA